LLFHAWDLNIILSLFKEHRDEWMEEKRCIIWFVQVIAVGDTLWLSCFSLNYFSFQCTLYFVRTLLSSAFRNNDRKDITTMLGAFSAWTNRTMCDPFVGLKSKQSIIKRTICSHCNINIPTFDRLVSILFQLITHLYVHLYTVICLMNVIIIQHLSKSHSF
jgi:hypothetical protein